MRVCLVVPHFLPHIGGGEQLYYDIAKGLKENGHEVRVITSSSGGIHGNVPFDGIDTYYYDWKMLFGHPILKNSDLKPHIEWADIVHTTMFTTATKTRRNAVRYKKPCVITVHEVLGKKWFWIESSKIKALLFDIYERFICKQSFQAYHVVSDSTKKDFEYFCGKKNNIYRIYNSIEMPSDDEISKANIHIRDYFGLTNEKCFLYYGRPAPNKGVFILEEAIKILKERNQIPNNVKFCWILANDPAPQRIKFMQLIEKYGIQDNVIIRNSVKRNELFKIISEADYVIIPSITEGFGFCAVEACTLKRKVIYSSGGSLPEVVFGKCLEFKNRNVNDLADKLHKVIKYGESAFENIATKSFEKERMVKEIISMYNDVLAREK